MKQDYTKAPKKVKTNIREKGKNRTGWDYQQMHEIPSLVTNQVMHKLVKASSK